MTFLPTDVGTGAAAMQKILGLGGVFFRARDPQALGAWYETHFGIDSMASGNVWAQQAGPTVFAPFRDDTDYFGRDQQSFMVNFRVADLEAMIEQLRAAGVVCDGDILDEEGVGRFFRVHDPEGNPIELWQPAEVTEPAEEAEDCHDQLPN